MRVFYDPKQNAPSTGFSPSSEKPAKVVEAWQKAGIPLDIATFEPLLPGQITLAHDPAYVDGVLACKIANGFGNKDPKVAASLPWTTGSFVAATVYAAQTGSNAASPTSGFHHAGYDFGGGFCTFNGLVIAARFALKELRGGARPRVGILDCDMHYGDGTANIIDRLGLKKSIPHWTFGAKDITPKNADRWLSVLPDIIRSGYSKCGVLLYQAGADPHIDDPLGGILTTAQLRERDRIVFTTCREIDLPIAWNLAGGYQEPIEKVLEIHVNTALECVAVNQEN